MNKFIKLWSILFILPVSLSGQNKVDSVLSQIEKNNTTLSALQQSVAAEKIGNKTGLYLQNPEAGINYLWSNPSVVGNRTDISLKQSFDFPTAYGFRRQIADSRNQQSELEYLRQRRDIMLEARLLCNEIIFTNSLNDEYKNRLSHAQNLANAYQTMFEKGQVGILDHNKAQLSLLNIKKDVEVLDIQLNAILQQLSALNGGKTIALSESSYPALILPADFGIWYSRAEQNNPALLWLKQEIEVSRQQEKLNRALSLPKASVGYLSEQIIDERFQGVTFGVSIPLWENKHKVKYSKAQSLALQSIETDGKLQFYNQLKAQFEKAASLQKTVIEYRQILKSSNNSELLKKALDLGEIALTNYMMELSFSYAATDKLLKTEYELNKTVAFLSQFEM